MEEERIPVRLVLKTCITALGNVVTFGESSCENISNTIKNLRACVEAIDANAKEAKEHDADDGQGKDV